MRRLSLPGHLAYIAYYDMLIKRGDWRVGISSVRDKRKTDLNDPVKSEAPGCSNVCARTFAPLLVSLRMRFQPWTPPFLTYRVPVTTSAPVSFCFLVKEITWLKKTRFLNYFISVASVRSPKGPTDKLYLKCVFSYWIQQLWHYYFFVAKDILRTNWTENYMH